MRLISYYGILLGVCIQSVLSDHIGVYETEYNATYFYVNQAYKVGCDLSASYANNIFLGNECLLDVENFNHNGHLNYYKFYETVSSLGNTAYSTFLVKNYYEDVSCNTWSEATYYTDDCYLSTKTAILTSKLTTFDTGVAATESVEIPNDISEDFVDLTHKLFYDLIPYKDSAASNVYFVRLDALSHIYIDSGYFLGQNIYANEFEAILYYPTCFGALDSYIRTFNDSSNGLYFWYQYSDSSCTGSSSLITSIEYTTNYAAAISKLFETSIYATYQYGNYTETMTAATSSFEGFANTKYYIYTVPSPGAAIPTRPPIVSGHPTSSITSNRPTATSPSSGNANSNGGISNSLSVLSLSSLILMASTTIFTIIFIG